MFYFQCFLDREGIHKKISKINVVKKDELTVREVYLDNIYPWILVWWILLSRTSLVRSTFARTIPGIKSAGKLHFYFWVLSSDYLLYRYSPGDYKTFLTYSTEKEKKMHKYYYWVPQKLAQIYTVIAYICIGKVVWFAIYICCNLWTL